MTLHNDLDTVEEIRRTIQKRAKYVTEELAGFLISKHLGTGFTSEHIGEPSDSSDCRILLNGIPTGLVEVTAHKNNDREALFAEILKTKDSERLRLPDGAGAWTCELTLAARIRDLSVDTFLELIACLQHEGIEDVHLDYMWPHGPATTMLKNLGIRSFRRFESDSDFVFRHMPIVGGIIDDSKNLLADFAEGVVNNPAISGKLQRLSKRANGLDRHFCIVIGSESGLSVDWRMNGISLTSPLPERQISLPDQVDSLWVMSQEVGKLLNFNSSAGWSEYQFPTSENTWWECLDLPRVKEMVSLRQQYLDALNRRKSTPEPFL